MLRVYGMGDGVGAWAVCSQPVNGSRRLRRQVACHSRKSYVLAELRACQILEILVEGDQHAHLFDGKAEEIGIGHLLMTVDPRSEPAGKSHPALVDRTIAIAGITLQGLKDGDCVLECAWARTKCGIRCHSQKACLCKRAKGPVLFAGGSEPVSRLAVMPMLGVCERYQDVQIKQTFEDQTVPPRVSSPSGL